MSDLGERRASGRRPGLLAVAPLFAALAAPVAAEEFEVLVVRGSTISRVSGDESGPRKEVTVREDPYPPAPAVRDEPGFEPEVVIRIDREESYQETYPVFGTSGLYPWRRNVLPFPPARPYPHDRRFHHRHGPFHPKGVAPSRRSAFPGGPKGLRSQRR